MGYMEKTGGLVPISFLEQILLDKKLTKAFLHFEDNRDLFDSAISKESYYESLEDFVYKLLCAECNEYSKKLIKNYIHYFVLNNIKDKNIFGNRVLAKIVKNNALNPEFLKIREVKYAFDLFRNNKEKYYKKFYKFFTTNQDISLGIVDRNILRNMISLDENADYVLDLFLKSGDSVRRFLGENYYHFFLFENLTEENVSYFMPYLKYFFKNSSNYLYFQSLNLKNVDLGKNKVILEAILATDENIANFLNSFSAMSVEVIIIALNALHKFDLLNLYSFSNLCYLQCNDLEKIFQKFSQNKLIAFLESFKNKSNRKFFTSAILIALFRNIKSIDVQKKYLKELLCLGRNHETCFDFKTFSLLLKSLDKNAFSEIISSKEAKIFLNSYEMGFLLNSFSVADTIGIVNRIYNTSYSSYEELKEEYVTLLKQELVMQKDIYYTQSLFFCFDQEFSLKYQIDVMDVFKNLFSKENKDKEIDVSTLKCICLYFAKQYVNEECMVDFSLRSSKNIGGWDPESKKISIHSSIFSSQIIENKNFFETFFHENIHRLQNTVWNQNINANAKEITIVKDSYLYEKLVAGKDSRDNKENYNHLSNECDANLRGLLDTIQFFKEVNPDIAEELYDAEKVNLESFLFQFEMLERKDTEKNSYYTIDFLFDSMTSEEERKVIIQKNPVLLNEYHANGKKKSVLEIMGRKNRLVSFLHDMRLGLQKDEMYDEKEYVKAIRICNALLERRKQFIVYNEQFIFDVQEKEKDLLELAQALIVDSAMSLEIVDYMIEMVGKYRDCKNKSEMNVSFKEVYNVLQRAYSVDISNYLEEDEKLLEVLLKIRENMVYEEASVRR